METSDFILVRENDILPEEVIGVRRTIGWSIDDEPAMWREIIDGCIAAIAARDQSSGKLVGISFIVGNQRHAVHCDFNVHKDWQGMGVGKALLTETIRIIEEKDIPFIYASLSPENTLVRMYEEAGFVTSSSQFFWNRRLPK